MSNAFSNKIIEGVTFKQKTCNICHFERPDFQASLSKQEVTFHTVMEKVLVLWHVLGMPLCQGSCMDPI